jgi:23S rRNA pseudouridine2604 synthase
MQTKRPVAGQSNTSSSDEILRLSKLMAERGICSRREADAYISQGLVFVNGERIQELGTKVRRDCHIELAAKAKRKQNELVTIILNKPIGYVSSQPEPGYEPAIRLLTVDNFDGTKKSDINPQSLDKLAVTGRLDIDSQGLLIFTQDGRLAKRSSAKTEMWKKNISSESACMTEANCIPTIWSCSVMVSN